MEGIFTNPRDRAVEQWKTHILKDHTVVDLVQPQLGWPDMVFTANAGLVLGIQ